MKAQGPISVLLVLDLPLLSRLLATELNRHESIRVVGMARDTLRARDLILQHHPEVIVLDVSRNEGMSLLHKLRMCYPVPVVACIAPMANSGPRAVRAAALGALEVLVRPQSPLGPALSSFAQELARHIEAASQARPSPIRGIATAWDAPPFAGQGLIPSQYVVAVGASTGGTEAIRAFLANAPADFPATVIVQHMPAGFTASFAERLDQFSPMLVREAAAGEALAPGRALLARGDVHLVVRRARGGWRVHYGHKELVNRHCPSVDVLFESVAAAAGPRSVGVLLTGMGDDGARGLLRMHECGALTLAQAAETCVVYGMPKVAVQLGAVDYTAAPDEMPRLIQQALAARVAKGAEGCPTAQQ